MKVRNIYTAVGCNRTPQCADWGQNGLIIFGACNAVAIYDPQYNGNSAKILNTFVQHTKRVNTVRWLRSTSSTKENCFISGADDGLAVFWSLSDEHSSPNCFPLKGHSSGVAAVDGIQRASGHWLLATTAADSTLKLWEFDGKKALCYQTISLNNGFSFCVRLLELPRTQQVLLAFSSNDETISLAAPTATTSELGMPNFKLAHRLSGYEDWVRDVDFVVDGEDVLLASAAQDHSIRLWRLSARTETQVRNNPVNECSMDQTEDIRVEEKIVELGANNWFAISLESVLFGHEGWVYAVHWHKSEEHGLRLLSSSIDKTLIVWAPSEDGVWLEQVRVGEVGGNSLGFFGGKFCSDGKSIMGHSYQGGFHVWTQSSNEAHIWTPQVVVGGHFGEVRDLDWESTGQYLMTVSADQTTRIHAPWRQEAVTKHITWHEISRPQVHGYDMQALAILSRYKFASGAEEKIVRTFQAPLNFVENFRRLTHVEDDVEGDQLLEKLPKGASVPSLGLSNKAVYTVESPNSTSKSVKDEYPEHYFVPVALDTPPQEETLMQNTLWPEVQKLYGHGYEIYALAATRDGALLASVCRATNAEHAQIIIWNTANWKQIQKLSGHQLTVTQLSFSPNGKYLLSVSRDRRWSLFERQPTTSSSTLPSFVLSASSDKSNGVHTRIIWACDWAPDNSCFVTSSRDGKAVLWTQKNDKSWSAVTVLELKSESITAVAFAPQKLEAGYIIAMGFETGQIHIYQCNGVDWTLLLQLNNNQAHHLAVKRLQFQPLQAAELTNTRFKLASCGDDHLVRIHELCI